jgi:hypothetical protein
MLKLSLALFMFWVFLDDQKRLSGSVRHARHVSAVSEDRGLELLFQVSTRGPAVRDQPEPL